MFYSDNPLNDFAAYDADQERRLQMMPTCDECGDPIQDDYYYDINGNSYCEDCMNKLFRRAL